MSVEDKQRAILRLTEHCARASVDPVLGAVHVRMIVITESGDLISTATVRSDVADREDIGRLSALLHEVLESQPGEVVLNMEHPSLVRAKERLKKQRENAS